MKLRNDLTGRTFGRLTVLKRDKDRSKPGRTYYLCKCKCGNKKSIRSDGLTSGDSKSCGCLQKENILKVVEEHIVTHGESNSRLYGIYCGMKARCYNKNRKSYKDYGGRGIKVCDEWLNDFEAFRNWAFKNGYSNDLSIDRIDNDGDYEPDNCRWVNRKQQNRNKRTNRIIEIDGKKQTLTDWCNEVGIGRHTVLDRINKGWNEKDAVLTKPWQQQGVYHD